MLGVQHCNRATMRTYTNLYKYIYIYFLWDTVHELVLLIPLHLGHHRDST